jgi:DNA-binding NarL/FixJ family response regulator
VKSRILIVDDHPIFRMGMAELLNQEDDFCVCAVAEDIAGARKAIQEYQPDMAIVDITLARDNGLDLVKEISSGSQCIPTLVLSMHDESVWAERAIRAGARGYIMKKEASESVISALRNISKGRIHVSENMMALLLDKFNVSPSAKEAPTEEDLTDRELEVFRLIGLGLSTREIASRMNLGIKTIGTYRDRIKQKLCIKTATELTRRAVLWLETSYGGKSDAGSGVG